MNFKIIKKIFGKNKISKQPPPPPPPPVKERVSNPELNQALRRLYVTDH